MLSLFYVVLVVLSTTDLYLHSSARIVRRNLRTRSSRIIEGSDADIAKYPHQAALLVDPEGGTDFILICGGTILSEKFILTAAKCFERFSDSAKFQIRSGSSTYQDESTVQTSTILKYTKHPNYVDQYSNYDAAIVELSSELKLNPNSTWPAVLPVSGQYWQHGTNVTVTGWGYVNSEVQRSPILQQKDTALLDGVFCSYLYGQQVTEGTLCVGPQNYMDWTGDGCHYDEGGPLVLVGTSTVVGILSYTSCGQCPYVSLYTDLAYQNVREFIAEVAGV